jgi:hypothetical protein
MCSKWQGSKFRSEVEATMAGNSFFKEKILPYNKTEGGAAIYKDLLAAANETFPQYLDEIRGMASGAGLDFSVVYYSGAHHA